MPRVKHIKTVGKLLYPPREVATWFGVSNRTLRLWEQAGDIAPPERGPNDQRVYRWHHIKQIAHRARAELRSELILSTEKDPNGLYPPPEILERLYRIEFFGGDEPEHGLAQLEGLARELGLSANTCKVLVKEAMQRPRADQTRAQLLKVLFLDAGGDA